MFAVVEQGFFGHNSVFESQQEQHAIDWMHGLESIHGKKYKIIKK